MRAGCQFQKPRFRGFLPAVLLKRSWWKGADAVRVTGDKNTRARAAASHRQSSDAGDESSILTGCFAAYGRGGCFQ
ncbi:hypothetical protein KCP76_26210 (plasmid) [Salmonella enterica subsp. enterica serovar Weltevreden]|nr:hypothetical protein KCP76_26210 [Salmonella enterica subsp. enterica serovar Weltevreden]QUI99515.1 hypothetical protein KCP74_25635 [Salmonella enterica subsp. enterica]QUJ01286.1 hypothetical protein KCP73_26950 [Salmonella enterica subsp. enterica]